MGGILLEKNKFQNAVSENQDSILLLVSLLLIQYMGHVKQKIPFNMFKFRSSGMSAMYHPGLCSPAIHSVVSNHSISRQ